jgi:ribA/ribD-fused uncharacterized protein
MAPARITSLCGPYRFLSNFFIVPGGIEYQGRRYPSVEHAYAAAKSLDPAVRATIAILPTPGQAKRAGRAVALRPDWEVVKLAVMADLLARKFSREPLISALVKTGSAEIVEGNNWGDIFWGVCEGHGENHLGRLLMELRTRLAAGGTDAG